MATGSGTGTPAAAGASFTLSSLRDRIRNQLQAASGQTEPLVVTASDIQLASGSPNLRGRVETLLQDSGHSRWSTDDLDEAIRMALAQYSKYEPHHGIATVTLASDGREIDISGISGLVRVEKVWWDYDSASPGYPPNFRQFEVWPGQVLYIDDEDEPSTDDVVRIWYTKMHTINGLDGASETTVPIEDVSYIVSGAAHYAAMSRAVELSESLTVDKDVVKHLESFADEMGTNFRYGSRADIPAWQRRVYAYDQDDIDEAIRWALGRYNEIKPDQAITTITLSSSGREISLSSVTDLIDVTQVWCDYTASDPEDPPNWREFEVWPGAILYIGSGSEPDSGDVARVWYTRLHTINGLDNAATTTLPDDAESLLVTGASGFVVQERIQERTGYWTPTKLREWAAARLKEFERGLQDLARREGIKHSGIAPMSQLDRWDKGDDGW